MDLYQDFWEQSISSKIPINFARECLSYFQNALRIFPKYFKILCSKKFIVTNLGCPKFFAYCFQLSEKIFKDDMQFSSCISIVPSYINYSYKLKWFKINLIL